MNDNAIICSRLALERCRHYISHIHAVLFLCKEEGAPLDDTGADTLHHLASLLSDEVEASYNMICTREARMPQDRLEPA